MNTPIVHFSSAKKLKFALLILSALVIFIALSFFTSSADSDEATVEEPPAESLNLPAISVVTAKQELIADTVLLTGLIEPEEPVFVQPQIEGQPINTLHVDIGDYVEKDQVLATLSTTDLLIQKNQLLAADKSAQANISQARAQINDASAASEEAERVRKRTESLSQRGVVSQAEIDAATAAAQSARARLNAAVQAKLVAQAQSENVAAQIANIDYRLARAEVKAPVSGLIESRNARLGAIATATANPMFVIIRDGALELRADVSESNLTKLRQNQTATIRITGSEELFSGSIDMIEPSIDRTTRLGRVRISIDDGSRLRSGMFAEAKVEIKSGQAIVLPVSAVGVNEQGSTALLVKDNTVKRVELVTGARAGQYVEIISGIAVDDVVVARAGAFVRDGDRIRPMHTADSVTVIE